MSVLFGSTFIVNISLEWTSIKTALRQTVHSHTHIKYVYYVADIWAWRERSALCEQSAFILPSLKSYITDIKRQTNFPPKLHRQDKRFLHWNVPLSSWGSILSFIFTVNTNTFSFKSWDSLSNWILLNISLKSRVQIAMHNLGRTSQK